VLLQKQQQQQQMLKLELLGVLLPLPADIWFLERNG
jgi:hypothetical protein